MERLTLKELLGVAKEGGLAACERCPSSPRNTIRPAWGVSCLEHGIDWTSPTSAVSMWVFRDPANTTPEKTGKLCSVCNSRNPTDRSAQHIFALWRAGVAPDDEGQRYLDHHYFTNAAMHGSDIANLKEALRCCTDVLWGQIEALSPSVLITGGGEAAESLYKIGLLKRRWHQFRNRLATGPYSEKAELPDHSVVQIFCTYHTSATAVNCSIAPLYRSNRDSIENLIAQGRDASPNPRAVDQFLTRFHDVGDANKKGNAEHRGMRVLLLHWLEIGEAIRQAHGRV